MGSGLRDYIRDGLAKCRRGSWLWLRINSSEGEHSHSKTSEIIVMYDVSTTRVFVRYKTNIFILFIHSQPVSPSPDSRQTLLYLRPVSNWDSQFRT